MVRIGILVSATLSCSAMTGPGFNSRNNVSPLEAFKIYILNKNKKVNNVTSHCTDFD